MAAHRATAIAGPNIALVKYWGDVDPALHLPANSSTSVTLDGLTTVCTVVFSDDLETDEVTIDGAPAAPPALRRVIDHVDRVRALAETTLPARVVSQSNFPTGAGLDYANFGQPMSLGPDGTAYLGTMNGLLRVADGAP